MTIKIKKGKHRGRIKLGIWWEKSLIRKEVRFNSNCVYNLNSADQEDTNKLFGIGYLWSPHTDSARFGWLYKDGQIQINAYLYISGRRVIEKICSVPLQVSFIYTMTIGGGFYSLMVQEVSGVILGRKDYLFTHNNKIAYPMGVYFGGNQPAPHDMTIEFL